MELILFDLGGVLYQIDYRLTEAAFAGLAQQYGGRPLYIAKTQQSDIFDAIERGSITAAQFFDGLRTILGGDIPENELLTAWNALLIDVYPGRVEFIAKLSKHYPLALLSNINVLHHAALSNQIAPLIPYFKHLFLSYQLGVRKPEKAIFEKVLTTLKLSADKILYIDDSPQHIQTAKEMGFNTIYLENAADLVDEITRILGHPIE